jgi:hypothetical protein
MTEDLDRASGGETEGHGERSDGHLRRRRRRRREESPFQLFLKRYQWELIWGGALVLGLFLLLGPLAAWKKPDSTPGETVSLLDVYFNQIVAKLTGLANALADKTWQFMLLTNWAIKLGYVLLIVALIGIPIRSRWWVMNKSPWLVIACPRCGGAIHRVHRTLPEKMISKIIPIRHYRCFKCRWSGSRIDSDARIIPPSTTTTQTRA